MIALTTVRVTATVATTHRIPKYDGFQLTRGHLEALERSMANGAPMRFNHDLERPLVARNVVTRIEERDDGELGLVVEFDVDQQAWEQFDRELTAAGAPGGFSFTSFEPFAGRGTGPFDVRILIEYGFAEAEEVAEAVARLLPGDLSFELNWLYQFSAEDAVKAVVQFAETTLVSIPAGLLSSYLYDLLTWMRSSFARRSAQPVFELEVTRPEGKSTAVKIPFSSDEGLRKALEELPAILRAEGEVAAWSETDARWNHAHARPMPQDD